MAERPRIAIIGAGQMGRWHLHTARKLGAQVVGVIDPDMAAARRLAGGVRRCLAAVDLTALLGQTRLDAAHVCTPLESHLSLGLDLVAAGIHALIEKPMVDNAADTRRLVAAAARSGTLLCPVHQYANQPCVTRAAAMLPRLGPLKRLDLTICSAGGGAEAGSKLDDILADILPHPLSLIQRLVPSADLANVQWVVLHPAAGEVLVVAQHARVLLNIFISLASRPTCFTTVLQCCRGSVVLDGFHGYAVVRSGAVSRMAKITRPFAESVQGLGAALTNLTLRALRQELAYPGLREVIGRFYTSIQQRDERLLPTSAGDTIALAVARDNIVSQMRSRTMAARVEIG